MDWRGFAKKLLLKDGSISEVETALLQRAILEDCAVDPDELVFLLELKHEAKTRHPDFDAFVGRVLASRILRDGKIDAEEVKWLRKMIYEDGIIRGDEFAMLLKLEQQAQLVCPEFYTLLKEATGLVPPSRSGS